MRRHLFRSYRRPLSFDAWYSRLEKAVSWGISGQELDHLKLQAKLANHREHRAALRLQADSAVGPAAAAVGHPEDENVFGSTCDVCGSPLDEGCDDWCPWFTVKAAHAAAR